MSQEAAHSRRSTDSTGGQLEALAKKVLSWAAVIGTISTLAIFWTRVVDLVEAAPVTEKRLKEIETKAAIQDDRWVRIEKFMERMDRRMRRDN